MRIELLLILAGLFYLADTANDQKYSKALMQYKKHAKIISGAFVLFSLYLYTKKNPTESTQIMGHLNGLVRYMPLDQHSKDIISPLFNSYHEQRVLNSGLNNAQSETGATSRSVSTTKKKYVAASQGWACGGCKKQLDAWFEVDHKQRLADGGSNHISNLVALCRNCHGEKTMFENM